MTTLVIVESPAKAKKIGGILGDGVIVWASQGHVRDLPEKEVGINLESGEFEPTYMVMSKKKAVVSELRDRVRSSVRVFLATDEDREGEAISWHLAELFKLSVTNTPRMVFHEITARAIRQAYANPRVLDMNLVDSQQARRLLDRMVGYLCSPLLCRRFGSSLSAGRVQSAALRVLVDREREQDEFQPTLHLDVQGKLVGPGNQEIPVSWKSAEEWFLDDNKCVPIGQQWINEAIAKQDMWKIVPVVDGQEHVVYAKEEKENPPAPFTTSTLQQESSKKLRFNAKNTMNLAQKLYEAGRITYHRTDSVELSDESRQGMREWVSGRYGSEWVKARQYSNKVKNAQEAHEAIRPVHLDQVPSIGDTEPEERLYNLIWCRAMATQMIPALYMSKKVHFEHVEEQQTDGVWEWSNRQRTHPGYYQLWNDYFKGGFRDEDEEAQAQAQAQAAENTPMNDIWGEIGWELPWCMSSLIFRELPSHPPGRYREASFVKTLEKRGIGRPSTYATIISTLTERGYIDPKANTVGVSLKTRSVSWSKKSATPVREEVTKTVGAEKRVWKVTPVGLQVNEYMETYFREMIQDHFTATMEQWLDHISRGETGWKDVLREFWGTFNPLLEAAKQAGGPERNNMRVEVLNVGPYELRVGKFGPYATYNTKKVSLPKERELNSWTEEEIGQLLPVVLGTWKNADVEWKKGQYGYYLHIGDKNYSWPHELNGDERPEWVAVEQYLQEQSHARKLGGGMELVHTRYGWAIKKGSVFASVPAHTDLASITREFAEELLNQKKTNMKKGKK